MHARVTMISGSSEQAEKGIASFRDNTVPAIKEIGGHGGILLIDRESGNAMAITSGQTKRRCARARRARTNYDERHPRSWARPKPSVHRYEVAVFEKS